MSPHLTIRGVWVFIASLIFVGAGALGERPLLLLMGEVMIGVLAISFLLCVVAALALDRRYVSIVCAEPGSLDPRYVSRAVTGQPCVLHFLVHNDAWVPLYGLQIRSFGAPALGAEASQSQFHLPSGSRIGIDLQFIAQRSGRWCLHGFDVRVADPLGLLSTRDYLPCTHAIESFPPVRADLGKKVRDFGDLALQYGARRSPQSGPGSNVRELRDYEPGDPLRHIAWKASARAYRLISRDFEREINFSVYLLLDISTSMRGGQWHGQKLEHGIEMVAEVARQVCRARDRVGLMTFDEKLYGHIAPATSAAHLGHLMRHLVGLNSVVDPELSQCNEIELVGRLADYLLIQERLDFRRGADPEAASGVNEVLMERWIQGVWARDHARYDSAVLHDGVLEAPQTLARRFAQLRGLVVPYRSEARPGLKEHGLQQAIEQVVQSARATQLIVVISDLCGIVNTERLTRAVRLAHLKRHALHFLVPFTPAYHDELAALPAPAEGAGASDAADSADSADSADPTESPVSPGPPEPAEQPERYRIARELFAIQEREDRLKVAAQLRSLGAVVDFLKPGQSAVQVLSLRARQRKSSRA